MTCPHIYRHTLTEQGLCKGPRSTNHLESGGPRVHCQMVQLLHCRRIWNWE